MALLQGQVQGQSEVIAQRMAQDTVGVYFKPQLFFTFTSFTTQASPLWAAGIALEPGS